jgi:NTP pyrophosphatase (non-canonical NTP hydrolase)
MEPSDIPLPDVENMKTELVGLRAAFLENTTKLGDICAAAGVPAQQTPEEFRLAVKERFDERTQFVKAFDAMQAIHGFDTAAKGFWKDRPEHVYTKLGLMMLIVSELGEATSGIRKDLKDDHLIERTMEACELADVVLRVMDYAAFYKIPLATIIMEKLEYNRTRPFMHGDKKV